MIISGAGAAPSNFTIAVTVPAVAGSTDGPPRARAGGGAELAAARECKREKSCRDRGKPNERIHPLCLRGLSRLPIRRPSVR